MLLVHFVLDDLCNVHCLGASRLVVWGFVILEQKGCNMQMSKGYRESPFVYRLHVALEHQEY
jgi:hypothetical protein